MSRRFAGHDIFRARSLRFVDRLRIRSGRLARRCSRRGLGTFERATGAGKKRTCRQHSKGDREREEPRAMQGSTDMVLGRRLIRLGVSEYCTH